MNLEPDSRQPPAENLKVPLSSEPDELRSANLSGDREEAYKEELLKLLVRAQNLNLTPTCIFITGGPGSGKTSCLDHLKSSLDSNLIFFAHFDDLARPSESEVNELFRNAAQPWSLWMAREVPNWIRSTLNKAALAKLVIFEGALAPSDIAAAFETKSCSYRIIVLDALDAERHRRLIEERKQPELADTWSIKFAQHLREMAANLNIPVIPGSQSRASVASAVERQIIQFLTEACNDN